MSVYERLRKVFLQRTELDLDNVIDPYNNLSLHDPLFNFSASDMLYIFFDVEKEFGITIPEEAIEKNEIFTINGLIKTITEQM